MDEKEEKSLHGRVDKLYTAEQAGRRKAGVGRESPDNVDGEKGK
jgi:hypothetical protein